MKILHVNNQASVGYNLSRAQREIGHESDLLARSDPGQRAPDIRATSVLSLYLQLLRIAPRYDLIHVHGGIGASGIGLLPYKTLGKRFISHFHGSELREGKQTSFAFICERLFVSTPDLLDHGGKVGGRELIHVPNPVTMEGVEVVDWETRLGELEHGASLRLAHMPTRRSVKGTSNVIKGVEDARARGANIELDLIESVHLDEAMRRLQNAHVCIDWLSSDYDIHGVVSIEAMIRGIPTICRIDERRYPEDIPIISAQPEDLSDRLLDICGDLGGLPDIGRRSREYALRYHEPINVARVIERYL